MRRPRLDKFIPDTPATRLFLLGGASGLVYLLLFTLPFPLTKYYDTIPPVDYAKLTGRSPGGLAAYVIGIVILFALYIEAIRLMAPHRSRSSHRNGASVRSQIIVTGAILAGILVFSYPVTAIDLFIYAIRTRGWALYNLNPLATAPEMLPRSDPWLGLAAEWAGAPSPYGPVWEMLSLGAFYLAGGNFLRHLFALKVLALLAYLGSAWLVYEILYRVRPEWAAAGAIAFAWSPLTLLESVQNGHNDILMVLFLLAAIWTLVRWPKTGQNGSNLKSYLPGLLVCLWLALSILVKFVTALVVPFILLATVERQSEWRRWLVNLLSQKVAPVALTGMALRWSGWRRRLLLFLRPFIVPFVAPAILLRRSGARQGSFILLGYMLAIIILVIAAMRPFWPGWEAWAVPQAGSGAGRSLLALLVLGLKDRLGVNTAFDSVRYFIYGLFSLIYLTYLWYTITGFYDYRRAAVLIRDSASLPPALLAAAPSFFILFWYVLLAAPVFHAWYLLWFLPLAALLLPQRRPIRAAAVFSITALLVIPYFETIRVWYPSLLDNQLLGHLVGVPLLIGPPALALLWPIRKTAASEV